MKSEKELSIKLDKAIEKNANFSKIVKKQGQRIRELETSRASWKSKSKDKSLTINQLKHEISICGVRPARHQYSLDLIGLCLGHAMGRCLEQTFKEDPDYQAFSKAASLWISKGVNCDHAYLLPPKQRVMARFMNIAPLVKWAKPLLQV